MRRLLTLGACTIATLFGSLLVTDRIQAQSSSVYSETFETGVGGWAAWWQPSTLTSTAPGAAGTTKSLQVTTTATSSTIQRNFTLTAGTTYTFTAQARAISGSPATQNLYPKVWNTNTGATIWPPTTTPSPITQTFSTLTFTFTAPVATVSIGFEGPNTGWNLDQINVTSPGYSEHFETGTGGWAAWWQPSTLTSIAPGAAGTAKSLQVTTTATSSTIQRAFTLTAGTTYTFTAQARAISATPPTQNLYPKVWNTNTGATIWPPTTTPSPITQTFSTLTFTFTAPVATVSIGFEGPNTGWNLDAVALTSGTSSPPGGCTIQSFAQPAEGTGGWGTWQGSVVTRDATAGRTDSASLVATGGTPALRRTFAPNECAGANALTFWARIPSGTATAYVINIPAPPANGVQVAQFHLNSAWTQFWVPLDFAPGAEIGISASNGGGSISLDDLQLVTLASTTPSQAPNVAPPTRNGVAPTWSDEFTSGINAANWSIANTATDPPASFVWTSLGEECYKSSQATASGGALLLRAQLNSGPNCVSATGTPRTYMSGMVHSKLFRWAQHGRFEARMKFEKKPGSFAAFWLMPKTGSWPLDGEIDIVEHIGTNNAQGDNLYHTLIWGSPKQTDQTMITRPAPTDPTAWHTYAIEWSGSTLTWFVDDQPVKVFQLSHAGGQFTGKDFFVILNHAVGDWAGAPVSTSYPATASVDYVAYYTNP